MDLARALAFSHFARRVLAAHPDWEAWLPGALDAPFDWTEARAAIDDAVRVADAASLAGALRTTRARLMLHTLARDLTGRADLGEVCGAVTTLAEVAIAAATTLHHGLLAAAHGEPVGAESGSRQALIVVGMGKLGGGELNVSSDVDLVFLYPEEGETDGARSLSNREFFERLGRRIIGALHDATADGYVFRVDMRLRPYGDAGPLAVPFGALEQYLITQGRAWERYAWLKARPLTGDQHDALDELIVPFVYRKYLDFDAYEGLRDIHRQIREQGARRDYEGNIKLGPGGIREIEFVVQAVQIVRGGREPALRIRGTQPALAALRARTLLPPAAADGLRDAYVWLRNLEHRLQYRDDQQTQQLPGDPGERAWIAEAMGEPDVAAFESRLGHERRSVAEPFAAVLGEAPRDGEGTSPYAVVWDEPSSPSARPPLEGAGFADPDALLTRLQAAKSAPRYVQLPASSRQRFDALVPQLLDVAARERASGLEPQTVFVRLFDLLETVSRRSAYLALLVEHPPLLPRIAHLMGASSWAADYLTRHPILLDELLDARVLLAEPDWSEWRRELATQLDAQGGDPEAAMDVLRHFQHAQSFRLLAQDVAGQLTVERLADHLSALADVIIEAALAHCWRLMRGPDAPPPRFAVVGYGKLGGKELGYASDLDLVFLFDVDESDPDADRQPERYARLGQRIITWLTATTAAGRLYDTDLRLRPDGASGLLVSRLSAFWRYQREQAWTWEHQALTRARFVTGDAAIGAAFEAGRDEILCLPRDPEKLAADVIEMRRRMHAGHPNPTQAFDLKHDPGGMVDIEFAVQYLVLLHSRVHPALTRNAGNIALVRMAGEFGLVDRELAVRVADAYREYRRRQHAIRLQGAAHARVEPGPYSAHREAVKALWAAIFGGPWH
jgi:glutamate-ammonia-ligase adenylyltransferase